jgi:hypothetical protein
MKALVCLLILGCFTASSTFGRDSAEKLREHLIFCNQFVVEDQSPVVVNHDTHACCSFANPIHNRRLIHPEERC